MLRMIAVPELLFLLVILLIPALIGIHILLRGAVRKQSFLHVPCVTNRSAKAPLFAVIAVPDVRIRQLRMYTPESKRMKLTARGDPQEVLRDKNCEVDWDLFRRSYPDRPLPAVSDQRRSVPAHSSILP